jgi:membrane-bound serine protease (ClpP class)
MKRIEMHEKAPEKPLVEGPSLVGREGVVTAALRPAGKILLDDQLYDAQSEGQFIEEGSLVLVIAHQDVKIIVKKS